MKREKTARTPHTVRVAGSFARHARSHAVRAYIPQVGQSFSCFDMLAVCTKEKAQHGTAAPRNNKNKTEYI